MPSLLAHQQQLRVVFAEEPQRKRARFVVVLDARNFDREFRLSSDSLFDRHAQRRLLVLCLDDQLKATRIGPGRAKKVATHLTLLLAVGDGDAAQLFRRSRFSVRGSAVQTKSGERKTRPARLTASQQFSF